MRCRSLKSNVAIPVWSPNLGSHSTGSKIRLNQPKVVVKTASKERTMTGYILTRIDIAALLKADRMVVHYNGWNITGSRIYAVKEKRPSETDPFATDVTYN
jgi:hypothetical protein